MRSAVDRSLTACRPVTPPTCPILSTAGLAAHPAEVKSCGQRQYSARNRPARPPAPIDPQSQENA